MILDWIERLAPILIWPAVVLIAILIFRKPLLDVTRLKIGKWIELDRAVQKVENKVNIQAKEITWIKTLIRLILSDSERANLEQFTRDGPFTANIEPGSGFEWELRHLLSLKLIDRVHEKGIRTLFKAAGNQNVKDHLFITPRGHDYLRLFKEATEEATAPRSGTP